MDPLQRVALAGKPFAHPHSLAAVFRLCGVGGSLWRRCISSMKAPDVAPNSPLSLSGAGRQRLLSVPGEPLFIADWDRVLMLHFAISPETLRPWVPFELDLWNEKAYVSVVAFTMRGLKP